jgi:hypothetical protein
MKLTFRHFVIAVFFGPILVGVVARAMPATTTAARSEVSAACRSLGWCNQLHQSLNALTRERDTCGRAVHAAASMQERRGHDG